MKEQIIRVVILVAGSALGYALASDANYEHGVQAGRQQAAAECAGPSRLERAAEWVSK